MLGPRLLRLPLLLRAMLPRLLRINCVRVRVRVCVAGAPGVGDDDAARMDTGNSERASHSQ